MLQRIFFTVLLCLAAALFSTQLSAQTAESQRIEAPNFTTSALQADLDVVDDIEALTEEQKTQVKTYLETAIASLSNAAESLENRTRFITELENAPQTLEELNESIETVQSELSQTAEISDEPMREEALLRLEQELIIKESELRTLRSEVEGYESGLQNLVKRQVAAPKELNEARTQLGDITTSLDELGRGDLDRVADANRKSLSARRYYRRAQISALEQEIAGLFKRQEVVTARAQLADLQLQKLSSEVQYLSEKTGQRRYNEASGLRNETQILRDSYAQAHPLVIEMVDKNLILTDEIVALASGASDISKRSASTQSRLDVVESDLRVATALISTGTLDRRAGRTLRRLSNQLTSPAILKQQIKETQKSINDVTQKRLIAQEELRSIPLGRVNTSTMLRLARVQSPDLPEFTDADRAAMQFLTSTRRDYLQRVMTASSSRISETVNLYEQQKALLKSTDELKKLLDEKLLWVPSVPAINFAWPGKVITGALNLFSVKNISLVFEVFIKQIQSLWFLVLVFAVAIMSCMTSRKRLWEDILDRSKKVGRVQQDNYWHTPSVIFSCILISLPFPLLFLLLSLLFDFSNSPDPLINGISDTFLYLSLFSIFLLTWRAWDRDKSLFAAHYKLPESFRKKVNTNLRWFIPLAGVSTGLITLTNSSIDPNIYEGFSLFAFVITALALSYLALKILWVKRGELSLNFSKDSLFYKYKNPLTYTLVGLPIIAGILALLGYYDTASELLERLFFSAWLFLLTYVVHGVIKRTVLVAKRQIAFRQAIEKRDADIKARAERLAAEERGEEIAPPPPVDTSDIDVKVISRQSSQLLNTLVVLGFAALMWMIWSDLLPALSIFNEVKIGDYTTQIMDDAGVMRDVEVPITLWSLIQAFVILGLTFIAAKNLPGFLEVFVLNRTSVDAGTRYAVTTILGYIIVGVGIIIGFDRLGLQWSQLRWIVTGLSVGIGFGLQKIIANFISGLIILFERPVRIGDYVTIGEQSGTVSRIQIRATTLADLDNREILIPNEALISERVTNWTLSNAITRLTVSVGIAYGSDTDSARDLMLDVLKANNKVLETPAPQVLFMGFGDSSLNFELRVFLRSFDDRIPVRHMIHTDINKALEKAGITIPFPQRDLNIVSQKIPLDLAEKSTRKAPTTKTNKTKPKTS